MHILLIPSWYSTPNNPIRGAFFREQALALIKAGHRAGMIVPPTKLRSRNGAQETLAGWLHPAQDFRVEDDAGIATYRMAWWGWRGLVNRRARGELALRVFDRYCAEQGAPDVLHGHSVLYGGYLAASIGQQRGIAAVLTEHSSNLTRHLIWPDQWPIITDTLRAMAARLAVSQPLADALQTFAPELPVDVIGNAVDADFFTLTPPSPTPPFNFALLAGLNPNKGVDVLLKAFAQACRGQAVRLRIAGEGSERAKLERLRDQLQLSDQVQFIGRLTRPEARDLIQGSHAVVSSSYVETFGVTLIEAFACGRPVVATRSGGPTFLVNAHNGILTTPGDVNGLAAALQSMIADYQRFDPAAIRAACADQYGAAAVVRRLEAVYEQVRGNEA